MSAAIASNTTPAPRAPFRDRLTRSRRAALEGWIASAIDLLDAIDGDADREPDGSDELTAQAEIRGGCNAQAA